MTYEAVRAKMREIEGQLLDIEGAVPKDYDEFNALRLQQDIIVTKLQTWQNILNTMMVEKQIADLEKGEAIIADAEAIEL